MLLGHGINSNNPAHWPQGCQVVRLWDSGTRWDLTEPSRGVFSWGKLDYYVAKAKATGMRLVFCLGATPQWAIGPQVPPYGSAFGTLWGNYLPDLTMFSEFVTAVVSRYQHADGTNGIFAVEPWNEWNAGNFLDPHATPAQVAALGQTVWQAVKAINPNVLVTTPTPCWNTRTVDVAMDQILSAGVGQWADVYTFHGYQANGLPPAAIGPTIDRLKAVMVKHGVGDKPLWETESGWGGNANVPDADKPAYIKAWLDIRAAKGLSVAIWYQWDNTSHGTLWTATGGVSAAAQAYIAWTPTPLIKLPAVTNLIRVG